MSSLQEYVETSQKQMAKEYYHSIKGQCPDQIKQNPQIFKSFMSKLMESSKKTLCTEDDVEKMRIFSYMLECYKEDFGDDDKEPGAQ